MVAPETVFRPDLNEQGVEIINATEPQLITGLVKYQYFILMVIMRCELRTHHGMLPVIADTV